MDLDSVTDIAVLKNYLKRYMRRMKQTVEFNLGAYKKGYCYFVRFTDDGAFVYLDDPHCGLEFTYDEINDYLEVIE